MPTNGTPSGEVSRVGDSTSLKLRISPYSPECVEVEFCELRPKGVLRSWGMRKDRGYKTPVLGRGTT